MNLFCIPCAGGSAYMFKKIEKLVCDNVNIVPLEIPGRGSRYNEKPYYTINDTVNDLYDNIIKHINQDDYCILGFSMGGILTFELCKRIQKNNIKQPSGIFLLGVEPPEFFSKTQYHKLDDTKFKKKLISIKGIPKELIENDDLFNLYLPTLRADFQMCETYQYYNDNSIFNFNFYLINGINDNIDKKQLLSWKKYCQHCQIDFVPGNHFFITTNIFETATAINKNLRCLILGGNYVH